MKQTVRITCKGSSTASIDSLVEFQGNLKELTTENYKKMKKQIEQLGFSDPIAVWRDDGQLKILGGHQRTRTLKIMRNEGWIVPDVPINEIEAKDEKEAKRKVLAMASQYGEVTSQGLYEFVVDAGIDPGELASGFTLPEIDLPLFNQEYFFDDVTGNEPVKSDGPRTEAASPDAANIPPVIDGDGNAVPGSATASPQGDGLARGSREYGADEFSSFKQKCPRCGFHFD